MSTDFFECCEGGTNGVVGEKDNVVIPRGGRGVYLLSKVYFVSVKNKRKRKGELYGCKRERVVDEWRITGVGGIKNRGS